MNLYHDLYHGRILPCHSLKPHQRLRHGDEVSVTQNWITHKSDPYLKV